MALHGAGLDHRLYVLVAVVTHAFVGYILARLLVDGAIRVAVLGAILPDVDLLFVPAWPVPLVHRGVTHTPLFGVLVVAGLLGIRQSPTTVLGLAVGFSSHLVIDTFTRSGIMWLYPSTTRPIAVDAAVHGPWATVGLWFLGLGLLGADLRWGLTS